MANEKCELCFGVARYRWLNPSATNPKAILFICGMCSYYFADDDAVLVKL